MKPGDVVLIAVRVERIDPDDDTLTGLIVPRLGQGQGGGAGFGQAGHPAPCHPSHAVRLRVVAHVNDAVMLEMRGDRAEVNHWPALRLVNDDTPPHEPRGTRLGECSYGGILK